MALEDILKKIEHDTKSEAAKIIQDAADRAKVLEDKARAKYDEQDRILAMKSESKAEQKERQIFVDANLKCKNMRMKEKAEKVSVVYAAVRSKILGMSKKEASAFLEKMMIRLSEKGEEKAVLPEKGASFFDKHFFHNVNKGVKSGQIQPAKDKGKFDWGFVLVGDGYKIDFTIDTLIADLKEKTESEVAKVLFA